MVEYTSVYISTNKMETEFQLRSKNKKIHKNKKNSLWRKWLTKYLISKLQNRSVEIRTYILQILGKIGDENAFLVLINATMDTNPDIRRFAISALTDFGDERATDALIATLNDPENDIRASAVMALGLIGDKKCENALLELLKDNDTSIRSQAVIALGRLGSVQALPILNQMIITESTEWIRRYISEAILEIKEGGIFS